jgi:uncharacterized protein YfeS
MKFLLIPYLLFVMASCDQTRHNLNTAKVDTTKKKIETMSSKDSPTFDNAHPNAKVLMNDDFFFSVIEETAPFGSDDGSDTYAGFRDWRKNHGSENPTTFLKEQIDYWGYPKFDIEETQLEKLKPYLKQDEMNIQYMKGIDQAIVAIAFGQLYLEGTIDNEIKELAKTSMNRELIPDILKLWGSYENTRRTNLNKLLSVLNQVK